MIKGENFYVSRSARNIFFFFCVAISGGRTPRCFSRRHVIGMVINSSIHYSMLREIWREMLGSSVVDTDDGYRGLMREASSEMVALGCA